MEIWKDINEYEGLYQISNYGNIKSLARTIKCSGRPDFYIKERLLKLGNHKRGYKTIMLHKNNKVKLYLIHRLVAETFLNKRQFKSIPDENKSLINLDYLEINHKNEIKTDNRVSNLEWCTPKYNSYYGTRIDRSIKHQKRKKILQYDLDGNFIKEWESIAEIKRKLHIYNISKVCNGTYKQQKGYVFKYKI